MMNLELYDRPGPLERRRTRLWTLALAVPVLAGLVWVVVTFREQGILGADTWSILTDTEVISSLLTGLLATLKVAGVTVILSLVAGLLLALGRMSKLRWISVPTRIWVEALRGLPEILLVFLIYLGIPAVTGWNISTFWALVVGLVLYQSASMSEAFRAGFLALPRGQAEAATALGVRGFKTLRFILLPQVIRQILPNLVSEMVRVTKASSLGFVIGYTELLLSGEQAIEYLGGEYAVPIFAGVAFLYVVVCLLLSWVSRILSERLR